MSKSNWFTDISIRRKLILIMLFIGLLPTLIVCLVAYITISNALVQKTANELVSGVSEQAQKVDNILQARQEEAVDLTNEYNIQNSLQQYMQTKGTTGSSQLATLLSNDKVLNPTIQSIYVVDLKGRAIATTVSGDENRQFDPADYKIANGQQTDLSIREDGWDSVDKLYITATINVDKQPVAYLRVIFYTDDIVAVLQDYTGLGSTGETLVAELDDHGNAISLFPLRFDTGAALQTKLNSLQLFNSFDGGYRDLQDYRGHEVMIAAMPLGYCNWVIATKIDSAEALGQIALLRDVLLVIAIVSLALIFIIALYFAGYFTKPLITIIEAAKKIGRGDLRVHLGMARKDEIGALADNIDHMGASLQGLVTGIEAQRNRLEVILNSTTESIFAVNRTGIIVTANQATSEFTDLPINAIIGKSVSDIFSWSRNGKVLHIDYGTQAKVYEELQYTSYKGSTRYAKLIVARIAGEQSLDAPQTIVTIHDETKSRELDAMKIDFVSMAAHELRTPLAAVRGYLELIIFRSNTLSKSTDTEKYLRQALNSTNELSGLINNLLDVTRIERGTLSINLQKLDLAATTKQAVEDARFSAQDKDIALLYTGPSENYFIIADQIAIHEVLNNLISNAIKYTNTGGRIEVKLIEQDKDYVVSVHDTGMGIPKSAQPHIFTKFYRAQGGLNSGNTGTGLGLYISKSIIERHNGVINFLSEEGSGSTFTFRLPIFDEKHFNELQAANQIKLTGNGGHKHGWITKNITR